MLYRQHNHHVNDPLHYPVNPCTSLSTNEVGVVSNSTASHHVRAMHATSSSQMQRKYGMRWICNNNDGDYHRISLPTSQPSAASRHTEIMARIDENEIHPFLMHPPSLCLTYDQPCNKFFPPWIWLKPRCYIFTTYHDLRSAQHAALELSSCLEWLASTSSSLHSSYASSNSQEQELKKWRNNTGKIQETK